MQSESTVGRPQRNLYHFEAADLHPANYLSFSEWSNIIEEQRAEPSFYFNLSPWMKFEDQFSGEKISPPSQLASQGERYCLECCLVTEIQWTPSAFHSFTFSTGLTKLVMLL